MIREKPEGVITVTRQRNFDAAALNWDEEPRRVKVAEDIAAAIQRNIPLSKEWNARSRRLFFNFSQDRHEDLKG